LQLNGESFAVDIDSHLRSNGGNRFSAWCAMYVCICNGITDRQILDAAEAGCESVSEMTMRTGAGACCGSCLELTGELIEGVKARKALPLLDLAVAA
jgi:bacterioferritin-associated ferredoxin